MWDFLCPIWDFLCVPARYGAQFRGRLLGPRDFSLPPLGAPTRLSCAAAGVSSGLVGAVNAAMLKSKLYKIEALTVQLDGCSLNA
eukprot:7235626-Prymnesium_polylepis.1